MTRTQKIFTIIVVAIILAWFGMVFYFLLWPKPASAAELDTKPVVSSEEELRVENTCLAKLNIIQWALDNKKTLSVDEMLDSWNIAYKKLDHKSIDFETEVDVERIIHDIYRLHPESKDEQRMFMVAEGHWCLTYEH